MNKKYIDYYFRFIHLSFWPILWYKWIAITNTNIEMGLFVFFTSQVVIFIFYLSIMRLLISRTIKLKFFYRLITSICFVFTLLSFMIFPRSVGLLYIKMILIALFFYVSYRLVVYERDDEGVVGLMSALLLAAMTFFY